MRKTWSSWLMRLDAYREREQLQEAENRQVGDSQEIVME